jgi:hypothetical protein
MFHDILYIILNVYDRILIGLDFENLLVAARRSVIAKQATMALWCVVL